MNFSNNDKKRNLPSHADENEYDFSQPPSDVEGVGNTTTNLNTNMVPNAASSSSMHNPYYYGGSIIPQFPFSGSMYNHQPMNYGNMMPYCDYNYVNKRSTKKKKNYHNYAKNQNNGLSILKEALVDPWAQLYTKYPNIIFD
ncbi:hypothetical protein, conserved [Plasmodium gonderi]|uniref:Uncharacterized protein n=1 Tax=Plasmodium gonderi TaxID=77519 RepID=A0A1Y1J9J8_PLAGO|nr:hypothetical protein, conserved [Plasmodium gonderi]GAW78950.1 hypothetical protein, conserved [Plasmodium gonderi]